MFSTIQSPSTDITSRFVLPSVENAELINWDMDSND